MRRLPVFLLVASLAVFALPSFGTAQAPRGRSPALLAPLQLANRALIEGKYDEIDALTDKLDARDPNVVAVRARAMIARGRYAQAESALRAVVGRAPASEAALELGLLQHMLGKPDATAILDKVSPQAETSDDPTELARAARALRALGRFQEANAAFRLASTTSPNDPVIETAWGELFLEKYDKANAMKSFQIALSADPRWVPALLGSAQALEDENPPQAAALLKKALEINPSSVDAQVFLAEQAIDASHLDEAQQALRKALAVNPSSLEAHALVAAIAFIQDKPQEFEAEADKALAIAPSYGDVYRTVGEVAARNYRFDEAVTLTRRALSLEPNNPRGLASLGTHLLRTGDEPAARTALEASFRLDGYNKITFNLLGMMDVLDKFVTVRDGDVVMRLDKGEAPVLQEYAMSLTHQALKTLAARYEFTPKGPILVEIFPKHDDFAVRNVGLPGLIGALGICFGRVVTMDSPRARPPGEFQWEATLWHELAHVITLQMSNQRIPRWLTEGISVYEEKRARAEWGREMDVAFAGMLNRGETVKLRELNAAFQNPKTISLAYYQASLLVEHLVTAYGEAGLRKLVRIYSQGLDTDAALKAALNTDFDQLQTGFDEAVERQFGSMRKALVAPADTDLLRASTDKLQTLAVENPRSFPVQMALGRALRKDGKVDEAMQAFERAAQLVPLAGGQDSAQDQIAAMAIEKKDTARAITALTALVAVDFNNVEAARLLARLLRETKVEDPARLRPVYERIAAIDPFDSDAHVQLGRMALGRNEAETAAREFRTVLALGPVDKAAAFTDLAESYFQAGKRAEAKKQTLAALEIAPTYERAQGLLLKLVER
ncbi:MAG TPA: tetratricopeptide repeat protein [Vicinamibacterales bacterium]|nr:tetratricopeptide repeat protein [Vicinamibacterales bacterium]